MSDMEIRQSICDAMLEFDPQIQAKPNQIEWYQHLLSGNDVTADLPVGYDKSLTYQMCFTIPHLQALKEQFASYIDTNGDEKASKDEIMTYLKKYNPNTTSKQVEKFIARRDKDSDGSVDFVPDYLMEVSSPDFDLNTAKEWFDLEDTNGDQFVSRDELIAIAIKVGMPREEAERTAIGYYMSADQDHDGQLSWEEYKPLFLAQ